MATVRVVFIDVSRLIGDLRVNHFAISLFIGSLPEFISDFIDLTQIFIIQLKVWLVTTTILSLPGWQNKEDYLYK